VLSFNDGFSQRFAIGVAKHPVTNAQYRRFLESSGYQRSPEETSPRGPVGEAFVSDAPDRPGRWQGPFEPWKDPAFNDPRQPVVCVSYDDALAYCKWVNTNLFRSSEDGIVDVVPYSIWDYATFGTEYPTHNPSGWMSGAERAHHKSSAPALVDMERSRTNERGISDLLGNVWEWCSTMYGTLVRSDFRIERGERPQLRGGSFLDDLTQIEPFLRASELRDGPRTRHADLGFRIFMLIPLASLPEPVRTRLKLCRSLDGLEHHLQRSVLGENTDF
jgi:formylglycine-generating enzyme required for sulfatase activity